MSNAAYDNHVWHDPAGSPFPYRSLRPAPLGTAPLVLPDPISELVREAERSICEWDQAGRAPTATESYARQILRSRQAPSAHAESARVDPQLDEAVLAAMALGRTRSGDAVTRSDIDNLHASLGTTAATAPRSSHAWIGPDPRSPRDAAFIAPVPALVPPLLDELVTYLGRDDDPPLVQAALAYAQLVIIHPFEDGNGRTARLLAHLVLARRGLAVRHHVPFSAAFATNSDAHGAAVSGLFALGRRAEWVAVFAIAARRAIDTELSLPKRRAVSIASWIRRFDAMN